MGNSQSYTNIKDLLIYSSDQDILQFSNNFIYQDISEEEFLSQMKITDIRTIIYKKVDNFSIFFSILIYNLHEAAIKTKIVKEDWKFIHNNLRVLIRVLPVLSEWEFTEIMQDLFWYKCIITRDPTKKNTLQGIALLTSLATLMQKQDFTLKYTNIPWEYVHNTDGKCPNNDTYYYQNRILLMQTLLALFGSTLNQPNNSNDYVNPFITFFITNQQKEQCINFYDSLLAIATKHKEFGYIPFQNFLSGSSLKQTHASLASQLAALLMTEFGNWQLADQQIEQNVALQSIYNYFLSIKPEIQQMNREQQIQNLFSNSLSYYFSEQQDDKYLDSLMHNILNLLENPIKYQEQILTESFKKISYSEELLIILSKLSTKNQAFYEKVIGNQENLNKLFKVVMYNFCVSLEESKTNSPFFVCLSILIQYSLTEEFGKILSLPLQFSFPYLKYFPVIGGNNGDFIVSSISQAIINGHLNCNSSYVYNQMALLLNISPHLESLEDQTASKLIQLMLVFTNYDFLLQNMYHSLCLIKLIQTIDHIISLQYKTNIYLIYLICKNAKLFHRGFKINFQQDQIKAFMGDQQAKEILLAKKYKQLQEIKKQNPSYQAELPFEEDESQIINDPKENQNKNKVKSVTENFSSQEKQKLLQYWSNYDWKSHRMHMPTKNITQVLQQVFNYMKKNNILELDPEVIREMLMKEQLNVQSNIDKPYSESFQSGGVSDVMIRNQVWMNIFTKNQVLPWFDPEKCLFFKRIDMEELQEGKQNNSLDVEHASSQDIQDLPKIQPQNQNQNSNDSNDSSDNDNQQYQNKPNQNQDNLSQKQQQQLPQEDQQQNKQEIIPQRQGNQQHPNNLYIISEADSRKEDTMMFNSQNIMGFRMNTATEQDDSILRAKIQSSDYKFNSSKAIQNVQNSLSVHMKSDSDIKSGELANISQINKEQIQQQQQQYQQQIEQEQNQDIENDNDNVSIDDQVQKLEFNQKLEQIEIQDNEQNENEQQQQLNQVNDQEIEQNIQQENNQQKQQEISSYIQENNNNENDINDNEINKNDDNNNTDKKDKDENKVKENNDLSQENNSNDNNINDNEINNNIDNEDKDDNNVNEDNDNIDNINNQDIQINDEEIQNKDDIQQQNENQKENEEIQQEQKDQNKQNIDDECDDILEKEQQKIQEQIEKEKQQYEQKKILQEQELQKQEYLEKQQQQSSINELNEYSTQQQSINSQEILQKQQEQLQKQNQEQQEQLDSKKVEKNDDDNDNILNDEINKEKTKTKFKKRNRKGKNK